MYRKLLATTALSLVIAGGAYAQETLPADPMAPADPVLEAPAEAPEQPLITASETGINADGWLATEIIGETIYNSTADDAEAIGDVNDFVLGPDGQIAAVVVGVGGFLGIGQKNVAIDWSELELTQDLNGDNRLVASFSREQIENAAEFNREEWLASEARLASDMDLVGVDPMAPAPAPAPVEPAPAPAEPVEPVETDDTALDAETDDAPADVDPIDEPATDDAAPADEAAPAVDAAPADDAAEPADATVDTTEPAAETVDPVDAPADAAAPAADPAAAPVAAPTWETYETVALGDISADDLTGTTVYGAGDEDIGSVGDIILSDDGSVEAVIVDFGGFLGIGTKPVAVDFDSLNVLRDENGNLVVRTSLTEEQLDAAPEYNEEAYLAAPGENVVIAN